MKNAEMEKLITKKKNELAELEQELMRTTYKEHVSALLDPISISDNVIAVINEMNLSANDCRYLGEQIAAKFGPIYQNFAPMITTRQARRKHKSDARRERRAMQNEVTAQEEPASAEAGDTLPEERSY